MSFNSGQQKDEVLQSRPPVVVVLGHVDHGKTSLLDYIRKTNVAAKEAGGITQHIGAYQIEHGGKTITFLDTPGHEAFSAMRLRGAKAADIAILVVAADEGVKPQTKEAINHAKLSGTPIIVAINKIDKPEAIPQKVKTELSKEGVVVEDMGGKVPAVEISAKTGQGVKELLDIVLLVAEMEDFKARAQGFAQGLVVEAYLDSKRGPTATLLVANGILRLGDIVATASTIGKVRILEDFQNQPILEARPATPAVVVGFEDVPQVGEEFQVFQDMEAGQEYRRERGIKIKTEARDVIEPDKKIFNLILKADAQGSLEAVEEMLKGLPQENIFLRIVHAGIGEITEGDVQLARGAKAAIVGFRVKAISQAAKLAEIHGVPVKTFEVIYELLQGVRTLMEAGFKPEKVRRDLGKMKVLVIFMTEKNRQIVGGRIIEGELRKGLSLEVLRQGEVIGRGRNLSLQENKKDIEKAKKGQEVAILYQGDVKIQEGDELTFYVEEEKKIKI